MRVLHITSPLLLLGVCACHHVSSELGLVDSGASSPNSQGLARFQDVDGDGVASAGDFITLSFDRSVKLTVEDASNILLGGPGDTLGAGATLEPGAIASEARVILGEGAVLRARGLGTGAPAEDENQPSVLRVQGGVQDADGGGTLKDTDWIDLVAEPSLGSDLGLSGLGVRAEAADLNLDGLLDWIVAAGEAGLDVYEAQADGSYSRIALSFDSADGLAVADLHGAGRIDIVAYSAEGLRVFVNQSPLAGPISFASGQEVPVDSAVADMLAHDVDGDGDNDLALLAADGVRIVDNSGAGLLEAPGSPIDGTPVDGSSLSLVDLSGDGSGDLVVARDGENVLVPLDSCGSFGTPVALPGVGQTERLVFGDLDRDGFVDAIGAGPDGLQAWRGAPGQLQPGEDLFSEDFDAQAVPFTSLALVDLDGDAVLEVLAGGPFGVQVLASDLSGRYDLTGIELSGLEVSEIAAGDADQDGDADLLVVGADGLGLWRGSASAVWGLSRLRPSLMDLGSGPIFSKTAGDIDGDGYEDLVLGRNSSFQVFLNDGIGGLVLEQLIDLGESRAHDLIAEDIDTDGDLDLIAAIIGDAPVVWLNDGSGQFAPTSSLGFERATSVAVGDLDGDGDLDVVLGRLETESDRILFNAGPACDDGSWPGFVGDALLPGAFHTASAATGDVDGDGDLDLLLGHGDTVSDRLFLNDGFANFTLSDQDFGPRPTRIVHFADLDLDGDLDIFLGKAQEDAVWHNDGTGNFTLVAELGAGSTYDAKLVDLNGDGILDLIEGREFDAGIIVYPGTEDGRFSNGSWFKVVDDDVRDIQDLDIDRDGDIDFVTGMNDLDLNRLWVNM